MFKTNENKDRVTYSTMLIPPTGYHLSFAVGTTYSLDLEALTAVCMSLGLSEDTDTVMADNAIVLLNALQKVSQKLILFCEAGQIKMPSSPSSLSLLLEKIVVPVMLPKASGSKCYPAFHPKTWLIEYANADGDLKYRFAVLSRNLTFDRSWDVSFSMESSEEVESSDKSEPLAYFLEFLREQIGSKKSDDCAKRRRIRQLANKIKSVSFSTDFKEFGEDFQIMPMGIGTGAYNIKKDPLMSLDKNSADYYFHELVVFSPFISASVINYFNDEAHSLKGTSRYLFTRKSELSKLSEKQSNRFKIYTLKDDIVDGENQISEENFPRQKQDIHAKIYLRRKYSDVDIYLGSMNASHAAVSENVELMIRLRTKNRYYNTERFLSELFCGDEKNPQNPFEESQVLESEPDPEKERTDELEELIKAVCRLNMLACVIPNGDKYNIELNITGSLPKSGFYITPFRRDVPRRIENFMVFEELEILQLSEFYMLKVESGGISIERIIKIPTDGIPQERENAVVNSVVKDKRSFVEYVAFVLGDDYLQSFLEIENFENSGVWNDGHEHMPTLYEKMLKTALEEPERLNEIGYLLNMITDNDIVPAEFRSLYDTFRKTFRLK